MDNLDRFIPQEEIFHNGQRHMKWHKGYNSVEVISPAYKKGDNLIKTAQIFTNMGNKAFNPDPRQRTTSSHEYDFDTLKFLLDALNRSH